MADPLLSEGARLERKAFRSYLRRKLKKNSSAEAVYNEALQWVLKRQLRYEKKEGGLGR